MSLIVPSRRRFLLGAAAVLAAPAIVRVASLMPVSAPPFAVEHWMSGNWLNVGDTFTIETSGSLPSGLQAHQLWRVIAAVDGNMRFVPAEQEAPAILRA